MPVFVSLLRFTTEGAKTVKGSPQRIQEMRQSVQKAGGKVLAWYILFGRYDFVLITEFPDTQSALQAILERVSKGAVSFETHLAVGMEEYTKAVQAIPSP